MSFSTDKRVLLGIVIGIILTFLAIVLFILSSGRMDNGAEAQGIPVAVFEELEELEEERQQPPSQAYIDAVWFDGVPYMFNRELTNILFIGTDQRGEMEEDLEWGEAGQADAIMLMTLDSRYRRVHLMQISRDTMVEIDLVSEDGDIVGGLYGQIALQYAAGRGGASSNFVMRRNVSRLLLDMPIHGVISLNIDGVHELNDVIGGVRVTFPRDYTHIDPAFREGETLTLEGRQAERFVQFRDIHVDGDNMDRMERQVLYFTSLFQSLRRFVDEYPQSYQELFELLDPFMTTDIRVVDIPPFMTYQFDAENVMFLPGTQSRGERYAEFHIDESALKELLINTFYIPIR